MEKLLLIVRSREEHSLITDPQHNIFSYTILYHCSLSLAHIWKKNSNFLVHPNLCFNPFILIHSSPPFNIKIYSSHLFSFPNFSILKHKTNYTFICHLQNHFYPKLIWFLYVPNPIPYNLKNGQNHKCSEFNLKEFDWACTAIFD